MVSVALPVGVTVERIVAVGTAVPDAVGDGVWLISPVSDEVPVVLTEGTDGGEHVLVPLGVESGEPLQVGVVLEVTGPLAVKLRVAVPEAVAVGKSVTESSLVSVALPVGVTVEITVAVGTAVTDNDLDGVRLPSAVPVEVILPLADPAGAAVHVPVPLSVRCAE